MSPGCHLIFPDLVDMQLWPVAVRTSMSVLAAYPVELACRCPARKNGAPRDAPWTCNPSPYNYLCTVMLPPPRAIWFDASMSSDPGALSYAIAPVVLFQTLIRNLSTPPPLTLPSVAVSRKP